MTAAALQRPRPAGLVALILALAAAGWVLTYDRMGGMDAGPGSELGALGWFTVSWTLMMAAMMLPAITPMVLAYSRRATAAGSTAAFSAGYLATWVAAGVVAYALIEGVRSLEPGFLAWEHAGGYAAAAVIAAGGVYQFATLKRACLQHCRDTRGFLWARWQPGRLGAFRIGLEHGAVCIGCCWALMAALLALGAMNLTWMALVTAFIAGERLLPWDDAARRTVAAALIALALGVALAPGDVPALTLPSHDMAMR
jgi:predicted metal-binding membrane protein